DGRNGGREERASEAGRAASQERRCVMRIRRCLCAAIVSLLAAGAWATPPYQTYADMETFLANAVANYPALCKRVNLGLTVQGRTMWALCITSDVNVAEDKPEVCLISTMHGDEPVGTENLMNLITLLTTNYNVDSRLTNIVNSVELWIVLVMNPDGYELAQRYNANRVDPNPHFPDPYTSPSNTTTGREIETANIMNWRMSRPFPLSANFHTGSP